MAASRFLCIMLAFLAGFVGFGPCRVLAAGLVLWLVLELWWYCLVGLGLLLVALLSGLCSIVPLGLGVGVLGFPGLGVWLMDGLGF